MQKQPIFSGAIHGKIEEHSRFCRALLTVQHETKHKEIIRTFLLPHM